MALSEQGCSGGAVRRRLDEVFARFNCQRHYLLRVLAQQSGRELVPCGLGLVWFSV